MRAGRSIKQRPLPATDAWNLIIGKTSHSLVRDRANQGKRPIVRRVITRPYDGFVYDLCGCESEAFFGGEKPVLLHNSRVRDLFEQGKRNAPCILFVDEIDAVGRHRGAGLGGGHDEREQTLNQLLVEMDGFESNEGVIMLAATNRPDVLDPALLRPGRFDRQIVVDWPDVRGREGILKVHTRKIPLATDVDLKLIARGTPGMAGADIANLVNEAALLAARRNHKKVTLRDFEDAKDKVMLGMERRSLVMTEEERRSTAYHESGHALVAWLLPGSDPVDKVTIIPRGRALGVTSYLPQEERHSRSKEDLIRALCMMMGGRAAEYLVFSHLTTGAANDIERATGLARRMVCELGMSDNLGPLTFGKKEEMVFLGKEIATHKDYSEQTAVLIDQEVRGLVENAYARAFELLKENIDKLHLLANTLLEREVLDGEEMTRVLRGEKLEPVKPLPENEGEPAAAESQAARTDESQQLDAFGTPSPKPAGAQP
jgi:cell division protease FtsH